MRPLALDEFYGYRFLSRLSLSPDGKRQALVVSVCDKERKGYESRIWIREDGDFYQATGLGKESWYVWEDKEHILFPSVRTKEEEQRKAGGEEFTSFYRLDVTGGEARKAFELPFAAFDMEKISETLWLVKGFLSAEYPDYYKMTKEEREQVAKEARANEDYQILDEIPFWSNGSGFTNKRRPGLFIYNMDNGEIRRITPATFRTQGAEIDGRTIYYYGVDFTDMAPAVAADIYAYDIEDKTTRPVNTQTRWRISNLFVLKGKLIAQATNKERYGINENDQFYQVDPVTGEFTLFAANDDDLGGAVGSDCRYGGGRESMVAGDRYYFLKTIRNASHLFMLDENGMICQITDKEGSIDNNISVGADGSITYIGMYGGKLQEVYSWENGDARQISSFNDDILRDVYVSDYHKLNFMSRGNDIDGWVLLPIDYDESKTYPGILDIHGGPKGVYGEVFYHEMQYWAGQGYFVFFCNPTGSSGRGNEFSDVRGRYGDIDYDNLMDFTDAVLEKYPQIDKGRVAVTGGSYGGYMCNWIQGHTDRFAAIATQRSISNWITYDGTSDIGYFFGDNDVAATIWDGFDQVWANSPLKYVKNAKTPMLFIHSQWDLRCPLQEGLQFFTALKELGVPARLVYFRGENHELSRSGQPVHRVRRLQEITDWIKEYTF